MYILALSKQGNICSCRPKHHSSDDILPIADQLLTPTEPGGWDLWWAVILSVGGFYTRLLGVRSREKGGEYLSPLSIIISRINLWLLQTGFLFDCWRFGKHDSSSNQHVVVPNSLIWHLSLSLCIMIHLSLNLQKFRGPQLYISSPHEQVN